MDTDPSSHFSCDYSNYKSVTLFPEHVKTYLDEELSFNAIFGPYEKEPFSEMQFSPFLTHEKLNSAKHRVIVDLSWPHGASINDGVASDQYLGTKIKLGLKGDGGATVAEW